MKTLLIATAALGLTATGALAFANETPVLLSERPDGCVAQIANTNAFAATRFGIENAAFCGFPDYQRGKGKVVAILAEPEDEDDTETE